MLEIGSNPRFDFRDYTSMGFPEYQVINPYTAPMRWGKYVKYNGFGPKVKQTTEYSPLNNYVYSSKPQYDYTKAYYKYPQYRKWNKKLQESRTHAWQTDFSVIPQRKVDNIQYQWNKYVTPIGVSTGTIGGFIDIYNNMNNREYYPQTSSYHLDSFCRSWGIKTTIAEVSQMRSLGYFFKINKYPSPNIY